MSKSTPTGQFDPKAVQRLQTQKKANSLEGTQRRLAGNDSARTRDAGTTRRTWR